MDRAQVAEVREGIREQSGWGIAMGVIILVAGILAIMAPLASGLGVTMVLGAIAVAAGALQVIWAFRAGSWQHGILGFLGGLLLLICGLFMLVQPLRALLALTLLLAIFFWADGLWRIVHAIRMRPLEGWGWVLTSGVISAVLGLLIFFKWPLTGMWAIGTLLGIDLIFIGWSNIAVAAAVRAATGARGTDTGA